MLWFTHSQATTSAFVLQPLFRNGTATVSSPLFRTKQNRKYKRSNRPGLPTSSSGYRFTVTKAKKHIATMRLSALLLALLSGLNLTHALRKPSDSVLLSKISSLTLRAGQKTSARRSSPIPQLQCTGGNARGLYDVDVMRCTNAGSDYDDDNVQWTCKASLPVEFKLGSTDVSCEGYDSPEDPYVLKGSCGVSYRLVLTEEGERKYGHRVDDDGRSGSSSTGEKLVFWAFFTCKFPRILSQAARTNKFHSCCGYDCLRSVGFLRQGKQQTSTTRRQRLRRWLGW